MIGTILLKYWKHIAIAIALLVVLSTVYNKVYNDGYTKAAAECAIKMKEYEDKLDKRIATIEANSTKLVEQSDANQEALKKDYASILLTIKGKPLYTVVAGKCAPTKDFVDVYNKAIDRANEKTN